MRQASELPLGNRGFETENRRTLHHRYPYGTTRTGQTATSLKYRDYGTLISLASFSAVGALMGGLTGARMIEGLMARWFYMSLYKMHQAALYGKFKALKLTIESPRVS